MGASTQLSLDRRTPLHFTCQQRPLVLRVGRRKDGCPPGPLSDGGACVAHSLPYVMLTCPLQMRQLSLNQVRTMTVSMRKPAFATLLVCRRVSASVSVSTLDQWSLCSGPWWLTKTKKVRHWTTATKQSCGFPLSVVFDISVPAVDVRPEGPLGGADPHQARGDQRIP